MKRRYKILSEDVVKNLIEFLDEIQFDAAKSKTAEDMQKINFCNFMIQELLNSYDAIMKPKPKSRDDYIEETFMDWNLPEMSDEEYNKLVDQVDGFLRAWEKEYMKDKPNEPVQRKPYKPEVDDVLEYCSLDEIVDFLKDDPELTDEERFELYYDEREKRRERKTGMSYKQLLKKSGVLPPSKN